MRLICTAFMSNFRVPVATTNIFSPTVKTQTKIWYYDEIIIVDCTWSSQIIVSGADSDGKFVKITIFPFPLNNESETRQSSSDIIEFTYTLSAKYPHCSKVFQNPCPVMVFKHKCLYVYIHELNSMEIFSLGFMLVSNGLFYFNDIVTVKTF